MVDFSSFESQCDESEPNIPIKAPTNNLNTSCNSSSASSSSISPSSQAFANSAVTPRTASATPTIAPAIPPRIPPPLATGDNLLTTVVATFATAPQQHLLNH
ncbi:hypothetical protein ACTFIN_13360 [Clostridium cagae]|uniref:hypothetical protein n=1 Tax=Clostridium cagae TaxID=2080751 RepID=UPI003F763F25